MTKIKELKRDSSGDYMIVLKSLSEILFEIEKNDLIDFLSGNLENKFILKNKLYDFYYFEKLNYLKKDEINSLILELIEKKMIEVSEFVFDKNKKVLFLTKKGKNELNPEKTEDNLTNIDENEIKEFKGVMDFLALFNDEQKKAILSNKKEILCIAGPGTGKTSVLTKRIEFLIKYKKARANEILAITFTKKAKYEMKERLLRLNIPDVNIETFNSFCEKFLLKNYSKVYGKKVRFINNQEKIIAISLALQFLGKNLNEIIKNYFSSAQIKNKSQHELITTFVDDCFSILEYFKLKKKKIIKEEFIFLEDEENSKTIFEIVKFLEKYITEKNYRTYFDQINDVVNFFKINKKYIPKFSHILVDEFQDVNLLQMELLKLLEYENIFYVGDPRQSIFGWRSSDVNLILNLKEKNPELETIFLSKNYRSEKNIVLILNEFLEEMKMPKLEYIFESEKKVFLKGFSKDKEEFNFIYEKLNELKNHKKNIFILARTNNELIFFSQFLKNREIKHFLKNENIENGIPEKGIILSTIHSIKGLEAEVVFIIGCNSNNFPKKSDKNSIIELIKAHNYDKEKEEKRLLYVGMSRAKEELYLTYSGKTHTFFINDKIKEIIEKS